MNNKNIISSKFNLNWSTSFSYTMFLPVTMKYKIAEMVRGENSDAAIMFLSIKI